MQFLHLEPSQFLDTAPFRLRFIKSLQKVCNSASEILLLQIDKTGVKLKLKRAKLALKFVEYFLALVGDTVLVGGTRGHISANVIDLVANIAMQLAVRTAEQIDSLLEIPQLVVHLSQCEVVQSTATLLLWHLLQLSQSLLVQVLSMQDICSLDHAIFASEFVLVEEFEGLSELSLLYETD